MTLVYLRSEDLKHRSHRVLLALEFLHISFIVSLVVSSFYKNFSFSSYLYYRIKVSLILHVKSKEALHSL